MNLKLHIDQITLEGVAFSRSQYLQLKASVEAELSRLFSIYGIPSALQKGQPLPHLPVDLAMNRKSNPAYLGQHVAHSIYTRLNASDEH